MRKVTCSRQTRIKEKIQNHFHTTRAPERPSVLQAPWTAPNATKKEDVAQHMSGRSLQALESERPQILVLPIGASSWSRCLSEPEFSYLWNATNDLLILQDLIMHGLT